MCGGGGGPRAAIFGDFAPAARRPVAALSHGGGRNGRGARPRSSPYLVKQATHWPAGQRRFRPGRAETLACALRLRDAALPGDGGGGEPRRSGAGHGREALRFVCSATGQCEASPKVRSGPSGPAVEVGGPTPLGARVENAWLSCACRPAAAIADLPEWACLPL